MRALIVVIWGGALVLNSVLWARRVREYELDNKGTLTIHHRLVRPTRIDVAAGTLPQFANDLFAGAVRVFGTDKMFVISGIWKSPKYGKFTAYVTDPNKAVVLQTGKGLVAISPDDPISFVNVFETRKQ